MMESIHLEDIQELLSINTKGDLRPNEIYFKNKTSTVTKGYLSIHLQ